MNKYTIIAASGIVLYWVIFKFLFIHIHDQYLLSSMKSRVGRDRTTGAYDIARFTIAMIVWGRVPVLFANRESRILWLWLDNHQLSTKNALKYSSTLVICRMQMVWA